jgi:hypothetical protein
MTAGYDIMILPGQSNSVGQGIGAFKDTPNTWDRRIFQIGRNPGVDMTLVPLGTHLQYWQPGRHGHGRSLARYYAEILDVDRKLCVIPAAYCGTSILQWLQLVDDGIGLYDDMAARVNVALNLPGTNRIIGWFEHQGERDITLAGHPVMSWHSLMPDAATYQARKLDLIDKVRSDFGTFFMSFGLYTRGLGTQVGGTLVADFETSIRNVTALRPKTHAVDVSDLADNSSVDPSETCAHLTARSQEYAAKRHFHAGIRLSL